MNSLKKHPLKRLYLMYCCFSSTFILSKIRQQLEKQPKTHFMIMSAFV